MEKKPSGRILLIEDSPTEREELAAILEQDGFEMATAPDADAGWSLLAREHFDLVLTDLNLPGASGFDLCRRLRETPEHKNASVAVITAEDDPANRGT